MAVASVTKVHNERIVQNEQGIWIYENYQVNTDALSDDISIALTAKDPTTNLTVPVGYDTRTASVNINGTVTAIPFKIGSIEPTRTKPLQINILVTWVINAQGTMGTPNTNGNWDLDFSVKAIPVQTNATKGWDPGDDTDTKEPSILTNSAGDPPNPPIQRTRHDEEITITWKTMAAPPVAAMESLGDHVNADSCTFTIRGVTRTFAVETLNLADWGYSTSVSPLTGGTYWNCFLVLHYRPDSWETEFIDKGPNYIDSSGVKHAGPDGQDVYLDGSTGQQIAVSGTTLPNTITKVIYKTGDFTPLFSW